jgi:hypothetical protein
MNQFDRLEAFAQRLVEGTFNRVFQKPTIEQQTQPRDTLRLTPVKGQARQWLLYWDDHQVRLGDPVLNIGRAPDNDIVLRHPTISRHHIQLRWRDGKYYLYPPDTTLKDSTQPIAQKNQQQSNTWINNRLVVQRTCPLNHNDKLQLGEVVLEISVGSAA